MSTRRYHSCYCQGHCEDKTSLLATVSATVPHVQHHSLTHTSTTSQLLLCRYGGGEWNIVDARHVCDHVTGPNRLAPLLWRYARAAPRPPGYAAGPRQPRHARGSQMLASPPPSPAGSESTNTHARPAAVIPDRDDTRIESHDHASSSTSAMQRRSHATRHSSATSDPTHSSCTPPAVTSPGGQRSAPDGARTLGEHAGTDSRRASSTGSAAWHPSASAASSAVHRRCALATPPPTAICSCIAEHKMQNSRERCGIVTGRCRGAARDNSGYVAVSWDQADGPPLAVRVMHPPACTMCAT